MLFNKSLLLVSSLFFYSLSLIVPYSGSADNFIVNLFKTDSYLDIADTYNIHQTIYLKAECYSLEPGRHTVTVDWITPKGTLERSDNEIIEVDNVIDYMVFFHFKIQKRGSLRQIIDGHEFEYHHYGKWSAIIYLDEKEIKKLNFTVVE